MRGTLRRATPNRPSAQNATPSTSTPAKESASVPPSIFPCVTVATTAPSRSQPRTSSIAAAVMEVSPSRVRVNRVWIRMRPMTGIAVMDTAVPKKRRNADSDELPGARGYSQPASA